ncbi:MAG: hypothetical protein O3A00_28770, partial [Planctomycetota bacterium]|nr:hypothetical protein [Planctomycetota bacterium]
MAMDWHRLFGISIADAVSGLPFEVLQELELARHEQRLDLAVVLLDGELPVTRPYWPDLPDGLTDLSAVNLFTYKSLRQPMSIPTLWELVGHFVDYAKERFADAWESKLQPPLEEFRLFAIATRRPFWLQPDERADQTSVLDGIYDLTGFDLPVRLIVPREVDLVP